MNIPTNQEVQNIFWPLIDVADFIYKKIRGVKNIPRASLRFKANGNLRIESFIAQGQRSANDLENVLKSINHRLTDFNYVLDFGCGAGRTLIALTNKGIKHLSATDLDQSAIRWAAKNIPDVDFKINNVLPPLAYADNTFDLIYAFSVFTHLPEPMENPWLLELERVLKPDGILIISTHGERVAQQLSADNQKNLEQTGRLSLEDNIWKHFFGAWYKNTIHQPTYIRHQCSKYFKIINYLPNCLCDYQDLMVLKK